MNKIIRRLSCLLLFGFAACTLKAQYVVNVTAENAFAEREHSALGTRSTPLTVPHLSAEAVTAALGTAQYLPSGSTPFTFVIAHRGSHTAPGCAENSACAIAAAYEAGADAIELDIKVTHDKGPVLGHDVAIARELNNWVDSNGNAVLRSNAWGPFSNFPILDYTYLNLEKYPFLNDFNKVPAGGGDIIVDPNNPTRSTMNVSQLQDGVLVDTYNQLTANHQLTLYEALYLIKNYYPMAVFLDVKNPEDLPVIGPVITTARNNLGTTGPLKSINLKLSWKTIKDPTVNGNPGYAMGNITGINYFFVFGTDEIDAMAVYNNQTPPRTVGDTVSQVETTFETLCKTGQSGNGCLGVELGHKYWGSPTQAIFNWFRQSTNTQYQLAAFHTVPQYSWYWQTLGTQKERATTYGRTFPRTDGSCCFALTDSLNASTYLGPETMDQRDLFSWNESFFSTITTDEPLTVLTDLYNQGKRPIATAQQIGGTNTSVASGGNNPGIYKDGLYYIQATDQNSLLGVSGLGSSATLVLTAPGQSTPTQMWNLSQKSTGQYTLTNAVIGQSISMSTSDLTLRLGIADNTSRYLWQINGQSPNSGFTSQANSYKIASNGTSVVANTTGTNWTLTPVNTPSSEKAQQPKGPDGYTFCADEGQTCNFTGQGSVAFGAAGRFRYLPYTSGPVACQTSSFNNIDPVPGYTKSCSYAPYDSSWTLSSNLQYLVDEHGLFRVQDPSWIVAYGAIDPQKGALYTYKTFPYTSSTSSPYSCSNDSFGIDPARGLDKTCSYISSSSVPTAPPNFTYCATEGGTCAFSGTAAIAFGVFNSTGNTPLTYKTFTNGMKCTRESFGFDPAQGVTKSCFYMLATPLGTTVDSTLPSSFSQCASEYGTCSNIAAGTLMAFGATYQGIPSYNFTTISVTGDVACNAATFPGGSPAPGITKACFTSPQSWVNRGPTGFTFCALEGGTCNFTGVAQVAFGADGKFNYMPKALNGTACNVSTFYNSDPDPNVFKGCFYRLY